MVQEHPAAHHPGEAVQRAQILPIGQVFVHRHQRQGHDQIQGQGRGQKLDLEMDQVIVHLVGEDQAVLPQHIADALGEIDDRRGGSGHQHQDEDGPGPIEPPVPLGVVDRLVHIQAEILHCGQMIDVPSQLRQDHAHQRDGHVVQIQADHPGPAVARLGEKGPHGQIDQTGVELGGQGGGQDHPQPGVAALAAPEKGQADEQGEQGAGAHAEDQAGHRRPAAEGGEQLVHGHHIGGGRLEQAGQAEHRPQYRGLYRPQQTPGQNGRDIGEGDGDGLHMEIAQEGEGHQKLHRDQGDEEIGLK